MTRGTRPQNAPERRSERIAGPCAVARPLQHHSWCGRNRGRRSLTRRSGSSPSTGVFSAKTVTPTPEGEVSLPGARGAESGQGARHLDRGRTMMRRLLRPLGAAVLVAGLVAVVFVAIETRPPLVFRPAF